METKTNKSTESRPQGARVLDAPLVTMDLKGFIDQIKDEKQWNDSDRNAITIFKTIGMTIVLIALRKDAEMPAHSADGIISLQVLEGSIYFTTSTDSVELKEGNMIALHEKLPHRVQAISKCILLLTVAD
ncbi:MAG TPA: hypothetical protein PKD91_05965 [Bacteroidia bacterium]|nr:hypothetical protein [Bacteroidia bacterium]